MLSFLSPGVYPREIDLGVLPSNTGPMTAIFVGTATKGPLNKPIYCTSAQQAVDAFGPPTTSSYLMYNVLAYMEGGNQAWIIRVGVEYTDGLVDALKDIAIDTSGNRAAGWGRVPLFTGIDYGVITLRPVTSDNPLVFHAAGVANIQYSDQEVSATDGPTTATLDFSSSSGVSSDYTGCIDDTFLIQITGLPSAGRSIAGATYQVVRNSDNAIIVEGTLAEHQTDISDDIDLDNGLVCVIECLDGRLGLNDTFSFDAKPDNRSFQFAIEGVDATAHAMIAATHTTADSFVTAFNLLAGGSADYLAVTYTAADGTVVPQIRTRSEGRWIQYVGGCGWAGEAGIQPYVWDIPRSHILGTVSGPYSINTTNNRVTVSIIPPSGTTQTIDATMPSGMNVSASSLAAVLNSAGAVAGQTYFGAWAVTCSDGEQRLILIADLTHAEDHLQLIASYSNLRTLRFAEEVGILYPYSSPYRGYTDNRLVLPEPGYDDPATPRSCEVAPNGDDCALDSAYFQNIVGWLVAPHPGSWINGFTATLAIQTQAAGDSAGLYQLTLTDANGQYIDAIQNLSFDKTADRYIGNVLNPGTKYGGVNGHSYVNWDERAAYLNNDASSPSFEVRQPSAIAKHFTGGADGVPTDPSLSNELDYAVIGSAAESTGMYAAQNSESFHADILATPGFSSGAVIGQGLQLAESRGDLTYLVDPPFGLRAQQVVDWHNGMLTSDLAHAINSSYGALYWSWTQISDQFNRQQIWIPPSGYVAGIYASSAAQGVALAPAGPNRGRIQTALNIEYNPGLGDRNLLQGNGSAVNPLVNLPNRGITVYGDRTLQRAESPLAFVHVRLNLNRMKREMGTMLSNYMYEPHDPTTWAIIRGALNPYLAEQQSLRVLEAYGLVIDASNNTPERRQRRQLWVSVFLKFTEIIEFILLNMVVLQLSASMSSEEVLAAGGIVTTRG